MSECKSCTHVEVGPCHKCGVVMKQHDEMIEDSEKNIYHKTCFYPGDKCKACDGIIESKYITALNAKFHPNCFKCQECQETINGSLGEKNGLPICQKCYEKDDTPKTKVHNHGDGHVHDSNCHHTKIGICEKCAKDILNDGSEVTESEGKLFHSTCFYTGECAGCKLQITEGSTIEVKEAKFHTNCFKCSKCANAITDNLQEYSNGILICQSCA